MQLLRAILTPLVAAAVLAAAAPLVQAQNRGDDTLLEMHQAFRKGDRKKLEQLLPAARSGDAVAPSPPRPFPAPPHFFRSYSIADSLFPA